MGQVIGKQSVLFENPPYLIEGASIVGQKEGTDLLENVLMW